MNEDKVDGGNGAKALMDSVLNLGSVLDVESENLSVAINSVMMWVFDKGRLE